MKNIDFTRREDCDHILEQIRTSDCEFFEEIGKLPKKLKERYNLLSTFLNSDDTEFYDDRKIIIDNIARNKNIQIFLLSKYSFDVLLESLPSTIYNELQNLFYKQFHIDVTEEKINYWKDVKYEDYKTSIPKSLHTILTKLQLSKLALLCLDDFSFVSLKGITNSKLDDFRAYKNYLIQNEQEIVPEIEIVHIDYDNSLNFLANIKKYLNILANHINLFSPKYLGNLNNKQNRNLDIVNKYIFESPTLNYKEIGEIYNMTGERVRQLLTDESSIPYNIFKHYIHNNGNYFLILNGTLVINIINQLKEWSYYSEVGEELDFSGDNLLKFSKYFSFFNFEIVPHSIDDSNTLYTIVESNKYSTLEYRELLHALQKILKNTAYYLTMDEIVEKLNDFKKQNNSRNFLVDNEILHLILSNYPYQNFVDEEGVLNYNIQPNLLSSINLKVERILFLEEKPLFKDQIFERLNVIQNQYDDINYDQEQNVFRRSDSIINISNNKWVHSDYFEFDNRLKPEDFINQFIISNDGKVEFDEVKNAVAEEHYNISPQSIRAYLTKLCRVSTDNKNLFIHRDYLSSFPNLQVNVERDSFKGKEIIDAFREASNQLEIFSKYQFKKKIKGIFENRGKHIYDHQIDYYFKRLEDSGLLLQNNGLYSVDPEISFDNIRYRNEPFYKTRIKSEVIVDLKDNRDGLSLNYLYNKYKEYIPDNLKHNNFYKVFYDHELFEKYDFEGQRYVRLLPEYIPEPQTAMVEVEEPVANAPLVKHFEYNQFARRPYNVPELFNAVVKDIEYNFGNKEYLLDDFSFLIKHLESLNNGRMIVQYLYDIYVGKTDYYDRFAYFSQVVNFYEPFLKSLNFQYNSSYPPSLRNMIYTSPKLSNLINLKKDNFSSKFDNNGNNKIYFAKAIKDLVFYRNLMDHDLSDDRLVIGTFKQIELITKFMSLYIYTISDFNN